MKEIIFIYWFAYYNEDSPSVRYRAQYPLQYFEEKFNIKSRLIIPGYHPKRLFRFVLNYFQALFFRKKNSVIVIQRVHSNFIYSNLLKLLVTINKKYTVYDLDDSDYLYMPSKPIYSFAKKCHFIAAGSREIAGHLSKYNKNIILTTSPTPNLNIVKTSRSSIFTLGWIGGFGGDHKISLVDLVFPAIKELDFPCKFTLMGVTKEADEQFIINYFKSNEYIRVEIVKNIDWKNEPEIQRMISSFDLGISTLLDNEIQRSKSGIKAKQYLNNGVPVLSTKLPENDWVVKDGYNGYFCDYTDDFKNRMIEFSKMDEHTYQYFSKNARKSISEFDCQKYYEDFMKITSIHLLKPLLSVKQKKHHEDISSRSKWNNRKTVS
ncbi:MAG: glycosyltransferase [Bacteroidales bacterium]|nr:glycosyltransferase [Bacteroidales bacterium]